MMLRIDEYRFAFVSVDGISTLLSVLSGRVNFQVSIKFSLFELCRAAWTFWGLSQLNTQCV